MKKTINYLLVLIIVSAVVLSCQKEEFATGDEIMLEFSVDTLAFDTVFTTLGTTTQIFKAYNKHSDKILRIKKIHLAGGNEQFRLNIDGTEGRSLTNIDIRPHDSLYLFVEATIDPNDKFSPIIVQDSIVFETETYSKDVDLIAWGQDMHVIKNKQYDDMVWENDKPYLVYDTLRIKSNRTLTIQAGVQVHFNRNAILIAEGELDVQGTKEETVVFQGARLEHMYYDVPGQWNGIFLWGGNGNQHKINYAEIKNAVTGLRVDNVSPMGNSLLISNSIIQHHVLYGLFTLGAGVLATNCVFADCGINNAYLLAGDYRFFNCTFANYWGCNGCRPRATPSVVVDNNYYLVNNETDTIGGAIRNAIFNNCIIYGDQKNELMLLNSGNSEFNYSIENCIVKVEDEYYKDWDKTALNHTLINPEEFTFKDKEHYDFSLDTLSLAKDKGSDTYLKLLPALLQNDILGISRTEDGKPDMGAYEWIYIEEDKE